MLFETLLHGRLRLFDQPTPIFPCQSGGLGARPTARANLVTSGPSA
jgi:hypothetical protein